MSQAWSWAMAGTSIYCLWLTGRNPRASWWATIGCQGLWITYAILAGQWGFIASSICFVVISAWNLRQWWNGPPASALTTRRRESLTGPPAQSSPWGHRIRCVLDPLARAELETIATNWREVHPAGSTYTFEMMRVLEGQTAVGALTGDEALSVIMRLTAYATHQTDELDLPSFDTA